MKPKDEEKVPIHLKGRLSAQASRIIILSLGLIVALAINELSKSVFSHYYPEDGKSIKARLFYAIILLIVAIFISAYLSTDGDRYYKFLEEKEKFRC